MTGPPWSVRTASGLHRLAVRLLPASFRRRYGAEIHSTFRAAATQAWSVGGARGVLHLLARAVGDCVRQATFGRRELADGSATGHEAASSRVGSGGGGVTHMAADLRNGVRQLVRRPLVSVAAIVTLALGIGANASMFSVVHGVLLRSLPYPAPDRLVRLYHVNPSSGMDRGSLSVPDLEDWAAGAGTFASMAVYSTLPSGPLLTGGEEPHQVRTAYVSGGFFPTMAVPSALGRGLQADEEYGENRVIVLSHEFWQSAFGADAALVGRSITLNDEAYRVAGVMPAGFTFPSSDVQAWMFLSVIPETSIPLQNRAVRFLSAVGRLADGVTTSAAQEELTARARALAAAYPEENEGLEAAAVVPLADTVTAGVARPLTILLVGVGAVLLIACVNVAALLLSRGVERSRELALRASLGASRWRLVRQFLGEAAVLGAIGGALGLGMAVLLHRVLVSRLEGLVPRAGEIQIDLAVLGFALAAVVAAVLLFGTIPALVATRLAPGTHLRDGGRGSTVPAGARRLWDALVITEVGAALVLVLSAGLLLRSLWAIERVDPGIDPDVVAMSVTLSAARYPERTDYLAAYDRLLRRLEATPGVAAVASIRRAPTRTGAEITSFTVVGSPAVEAQPPRATVQQVSPGFFSVVGTPVLQGREFTDEDRTDGPSVVVVNEALRRRFLADGSAVGTEIEGPGGRSRIVGVVADIRQDGPAQPAPPTIYVPQAQIPRRAMTFVVAAEGTGAGLVQNVRSAVRSADPDQPIESLSLLGDLIYQAAGRERLYAAILAGFGALGLLLASVGIYGVVSTAVARRTNEIGTRLALGATRASILGLVVSTAMRPVWIGAAIGVAAAWVSVRALESVVFGIDPRDPLTFGTVTLVLLAVAAFASWLPASRASRLHPVDALRWE